MNSEPVHHRFEGSDDNNRTNPVCDPKETGPVELSEKEISEAVEKAKKLARISLEKKLLLRFVLFISEFTLFIPVVLSQSSHYLYRYYVQSLLSKHTVWQVQGRQYSQKEKRPRPAPYS